MTQLLLPNINSYIKFELNRLKNTQNIERKRISYGRIVRRADGRTDIQHKFLNRGYHNTPHLLVGGGGYKNE